MPTKEELLVKFASQTGAEIPGIQSQQADSTDININTDAPDLTQTPTPIAATTPTESTTLPEDEELFVDSFSDRTKIPLWEDPKFKGIIVALCVLPAVMTVGWIFKDGIPKPNLSTKSSRPAPVRQESDEDKPKDATDGEWASYAATNGMRQQFSENASHENTDAQKKFQERTLARKKSQVSSATTVKPNTRIERTSERADSVPTYRSYTPPAPVRTARSNVPEDYTQSSHRVSRSYTPPIQKPISYRVPPALSKPPAVSPTNSQSLDSSQQQNSPQERIAAIIAATSTNSSNEPATVAATSTDESSESAIVTSTGFGKEPALIASTVIPPRSRAINSRATRSSGRSPDSVAHLSSEAAVIDGQPQTLINRSLSTRGILLTSIAFTAGDYATIANQPVEIELKEALGDIPAGARIVAVVEAKQNNYSGNGKSEVVRLGAIAIVIGDMEMPLPDGAISLSGSDGAPLIAKTGGSSFRRFVGGLAGTVAGGAGLTNFGASQNVQIGDSSYTDKLATPVGEKVQQALENPNELKGSVRVVVDGEKVYHAKNGQVLENKHSLTLENSPVTHQKSLNVVPEVAQVSELQTQNLPVTPEKSLNVVPEGDRAEIKGAVVLDVSPVVENQKSNSGAIVLARQDKEMIPFPINPTPIELDVKMPEVVNPNKATERGSVEQALASANARIDSLQAQLKDTQKSLEDLSKFVRNDNLKSWAEHKVTEVTKTSQSIAEQAKSKVMQWVQAKTVQVKEAVQGKVNEVKTFAQDKVNEVKTAAQIKVNEVKTVAQDKVNEVKTAAQLKGIDFKESVREQANKFLAPVNSAQVERAAKHIVREFGDGKSYNKAATHSFQLNDKNELSVARQSDGAVIYQKGALTKAANSHDILKLNALPTVVNQIKEKQMQSTPKQQMEVGS